MGTEEKILIVSLLLIFTLAVGFIRIISELSFPGKLAMIEQLRQDSANVASVASEDVLGQVTKFNQQIKAAQRYRTFWWGRIVVPEEWEAVDVIDIPL